MLGATLSEEVWSVCDSEDVADMECTVDAEETEVRDCTEETTEAVN